MKPLGGNPNVAILTQWISRSWSPLALIAIAVAKLVLVADQEIGATTRAHDDLWQIMSANAWYWFRPYDNMALIHLPIYPITLAMLEQTRIPLRITTELLYLASAASFVLAWRRLAFPPLFQVLGFALIAFHPYSLGLFTCTFAEDLYTCLMLLVCGQLMRVIATKGGADLTLNAILLAVFFALAWFTRPESMLLGGFLAVVAVTILAGWLLHWMTPRDAVKWVGSLVVVPLVAVLLLGGAIMLMNIRMFGLWATYDLAAPNYIKAYSALQSIAIDHPILRVPVPAEAREKAYAVSPTFRQLRPFLEGPLGQWGKSEGQVFAGVADIYAGLFYWILREAVHQSGHYQSVAASEDFYGRIAAELNSAFRQKGLAKRTVLIPFVDPSFSVWMPLLPESVLRVGTLLYPHSSPDSCPATQPVPRNIGALYDQVANRRAPALPVTAPAHIEGWISTRDAPIKDLQLLNKSLTSVQAKIETHPLPEGELTREWQPPLFYAIDWAYQRAESPYRIRANLENGQFRLTKPLSELPVGKRLVFDKDNYMAGTAIMVNQLQQPQLRETWREVLRDQIGTHYGDVLAMLWWAALVSLCVVTLWGWPFPTTLTFALCAIIVLISSRVLLFAILDASAWSGTQIRYLFPVAVLAAAFPALILGGLARRLPGL